MCHANNEKRNKTNTTTKSKKKHNPQRKGNLQVLGNTGSEHHQICGKERKSNKRESQENKKSIQN